MTAMTAMTANVSASARCKSCGAPIVWARTASGKASPFQADDAGFWTIVDGVARLVDAQFAGPRLTSHFATCPQHEQWRRRR